MKRAVQRNTFQSSSHRQNKKIKVDKEKQSSHDGWKNKTSQFTRSKYIQRVKFISGTIINCAYKINSAQSLIRSAINSEMA